MQNVPGAISNASPAATAIHPINPIEGIRSRRMPGDGDLRGCWLGLDFGTPSAKALLVDERGAITGRAAARYASAPTAVGEHEQDPRAYLGAAREAIAACGAAGAELRGIGLVGQTPTLVLVDAAGEPVRHALTWQDHRADAEARTLERELGSGELLFGTELPWT